ncbi:hypothetical protein [Sphingobacterium hotanense]|uniref:hypothetical protein n=1 Tax=Sphingobacterium hotanense TaxID=649196 RepID=UPI0021A4507D|nr:hypothetical protein [Sphingobacterium hotanense]MCT1525306.1 hypothetical protein [Sphingobacterium hotanense]
MKYKPIEEDRILLDVLSEIQASSGKCITPSGFKDIDLNVKQRLQRTLVIGGLAVPCSSHSLPQGDSYLNEDIMFSEVTEKGQQILNILQEAFGSK